MGQLKHETLPDGHTGTFGYGGYTHVDHHLIGGTAGLNIVRGATLVVAASNASAASKAQADYLCDGTADDVDIQAAHDALPLIGGVRTGRIQLTEGLFEIAAMMTLTGHVELVGMGQGGFWETTTIGTTVLRASAASLASTPEAVDLPNGVMFYLNPATVQDHYIRLANCKITMTGSAYRTVGGIYGAKDAGAGTGRNIWLEDSLVLGGYHGVYMRGINNFRANRVWVRSVNATSGTGFYFNGGSDMQVNACIAEGVGLASAGTTQNGFYLTGAGTSRFLNCWAQNNYRGWYIDSTSANNALWFCTGDYNTAAGALVGGGCDRLQVIGGHFNNNGKAAVAGIGIDMYADYARIIGVSLDDYQGTPRQNWGYYERTGADHNTVALCDFTGNTQSPPYVLVGTNSRIRLFNKGLVTENSGAATGTGAQQTVAHGLAFTPTRQQIALTAGSATALPFHSANPDATNIYVTAANLQAWYWATVG